MGTGRCGGAGKRLARFSLVLGVVATLALWSGASAAHADSLCGAYGSMSTNDNSVTCTYTAASADTFTVPWGVGSLSVEVIGAPGGSSDNGDQNPPGPGGVGGDVTAALKVSGGTVLQVSVGVAGRNASTSGNNEAGAGGNGIGAGGAAGSGSASGGRGGTEAGGGGGAGGVDGGGGGGGASSLYMSQTQLLIVAAGGGGGGDRGAVGSNANAANTADGGAGGQPVRSYIGGSGGTAAGTGGTFDTRASFVCGSSCNGDGGNAAGGTVNGYPAAPGSGAGGFMPGGGGGGGGYAGGGAGYYGSGGGAGSSYADSTVATNVDFAPAAAGATPAVRITFQKDVTPPTLTLPGTDTVKATGPSGAVVNYPAVTATDSDNAPTDLTVSCSPGSGSTFAIGTTTVNCTASDPAGNSSSGSFSVVVVGAVGQVSSLISTVDGFGLGHGPQTSFDSQLKAVQSDLAATNTGQACTDLASFINHVKAESGKQLTTAQASSLLAAAQQIQAVIGC